MNKYKKNLVNAMQLCSIVLFTLFVAASTQAQTPASTLTGAPVAVPASAPANDEGSDTKSVKPIAPRFKLSPLPSLFRLTPANGKQVLKRSTTNALMFSEMTAQKFSQPLFTVARDATLQGDGTSAFPLGIKVPLNLNGSLTVAGLIKAISPSGNAVEANAGTDTRGRGATGVNANGGLGLGVVGGVGVMAQGGDGGSGLGGNGVVAFAGHGDFTGGNGVIAGGGASENGFGGKGVVAIGGRSKNNRGGIGVEIEGGSSESGDGGVGLDVTGGSAGANRTSGTGIFVRAGTAFNGGFKGLAGQFIGSVRIEQGDLFVSGNLTKGGGSFKIDHPLDPENKYLYHSFVESPDMMNIYNGTVTTDGKGNAVVELPGYFGALNRDFRYQLTVIGKFAQAIVAEKIKDNRFRIKTDSPNVEVSWQVTGIRQDAYANKNRIPVEQDKPEQERGLYLYPDAFGKTEEKSVLMVQHPEIKSLVIETPEKVRKEKLQ